MDKRDTIVASACETLVSAGADHITVSLVAKAARVSTALVHYHFATKQKLLAAAADALSTRRAEDRVAALATGPGLAGLDALWSVLADDRAAGERALADLTLLARNDHDLQSALRRQRQRERARIAMQLPGLFRSLGAVPRIPSEELAATVCTFLDGAVLALLSGTPADDVRASYDAFWLALVALGQAAPRAG